MKTAPSLAEIRSWPATINVSRAALALGCSPSHLYELIKRGQAPVRLLRLGAGRTVVVTASLVTLLSDTDHPQPPAPAALKAA
jgi:hypothetical protein